jgi:hypothetical protein
MDEKRKKALDAAAILNSPVFADAVESIKGRAVEMWQAAKTPQEREEAWHLQRAVAVLYKEIFNILQCAAVNAGGKDEALNTELAKVKEKRNGGRKRSS